MAKKKTSRKKQQRTSKIVAPAAAKVTVYHSSKGKKAASPPSAKTKSLAKAAAGYTISLRFRGNGLTASQQAVFKVAADRWTKAIKGALPTFDVGGGITTNGIVIVAEGISLDGVGNTLGQAGPRKLRPGSNLPALGLMSFDSADLTAMERKGTLTDVITHEMGHCLGIGTIWTNKGLLRRSSPNNVFVGPKATAEFGRSIPVENDNLAGTKDSHWEEEVFGNELMSGFIRQPGNPLSRMTLASLIDLGYEVDLSAAEPFTLPSRAKAKSIAKKLPPCKHSMPVFDPEVLPPDAEV